MLPWKEGDPMPLCACGCGREVELAKWTNPLGQYGRKWATVAGQPKRFLIGHGGRKIDYWDEEDRGYETPCWIWRGWLSPITGYADDVWIDNRRTTAHVAAYIRENGPVPEGHHVHHRCEVKACVRPSHLEAVTPAQHRREHARKLSHTDVDEIRASNEAPEMLAQRFDVQPRWIKEILSGKAWTV